MGLYDKNVRVSSRHSASFLSINMPNGQLKRTLRIVDLPNRQALLASHAVNLPNR